MIFSKPQESLIYAEKAYKIARNLNNNKYLLDIYDNLIEANVELYNLEIAEKYCREALQLAEKLKNEKEIAFYSDLMGTVKMKAEDYATSLSNFRKALEIEKKNGFERRMASTLNNIGAVNLKTGHMDKALANFLESLRIKEKIGDERQIASSQLNIGSFLLRQKKYREAEEYLNKAEKSFSHLNSQVRLGNVLALQSIVYRETGEFSKAEAKLKKLLELRKSIGNKQNIAITYNKIGLFYFAQNKFGKSIFYFKKAFELAQKSGYENGVSIAAIHLVRAFQNLNQPQKAAFYFQVLRKSTDKIKDREILLGNYQSIYEYYDKLNNAPQTLRYLKKYIALKDSIQNLEKEKYIEKLQMKYETEKKEKEIELLNRDKQIQTLAFSRQKFVRNTFIVGFIILLILVIIILRIKQKQLAAQKRVEAEIKKMNRELEKRVQTELKKREEQQQLLIQKSKLESLGKLAAGIAHEINQPLTRLSLGVDNILYKIKKDKRFDLDYIKKKCDTFLENIVRIQNIIEHIRTFSRDQKSTTFDRIDINRTVKDALKFIETQYKNHGINLELHLGKIDGFILGNKFKLEQIFLNLLTNARDAIEEKFKDAEFSKNKIVIRIFREADKICFEIEDNGCGISNENLKKVFDPFFTTKPIEKGTGLGLSIIYGLVQEMKGEIKIQSKENKFTKIKISFPKIGKKEKVNRT